jgi:hypothetical protein
VRTQGGDDLTEQAVEDGLWVGSRRRRAEHEVPGAGVVPRQSAIWPTIFSM